MDTIVLTTSNSKTSEPHKYSYKLTSSMQLADHYVCLSNLSMYYTWRNITESYKNNRMTYTVGGDSVDIVLDDGSYAIKDINNYLHLEMLKNGHARKGNYPISIYPNIVLNRISVVVNESSSLTLTKGMAQVLGFSNPNITTATHGDLVPMLERVEGVLVHCNLAQNNFTRDSSLIFSFVPDSTFGTQLHQKPNFPLWRPARKNSEISEIDVWFTDQDYRPLEIEDNILVEIQLAPTNFVSKS